MAYVSQDAKAFYLSKEALVQLQVMPKDFPKIGSATAHHEVGGITGKVDTADAEFVWLQSVAAENVHYLHQNQRNCHLRLQKTMSQK